METIKLSSNLPQIYKDAVNKMIDSMKNFENEICNNPELSDEENEILDKRKNPFQEFGKKFTIIPELWKCQWPYVYVNRIYADCLQFRFMHHNNIAFDDVLNDCKMVKENPLFRKKLLTFDYESFKDIVFYRMNIGYTWLNMPYGYRFSNINKRRICFSEMKAALQFPNCEMKNFMQEYLNFADSPIENNVLKKYNKSLLIYEKISAVDEKNFEEWFLCLTEFDDEEFVIFNVEYRIGKDPGNQRLWKLYINYLNNQNTLKVLNIYRNYCRLFVEDFEMQNEYRKMIEKFAKLNFDVSKWYIDTVCFERDFISVKNAANLLINALQTLSKRSDNLHKFAIEFIEQHGHRNEINLALIKHQSMPKKFEEAEMMIPEVSEKIDMSFEDFCNTVITYNNHIAIQDKLIKKFPKPLFKYILKQIFDDFNLYIKSIKTCKYFFLQNECIVPVWNLTFNEAFGHTVMYNEYSIHFNTENVLQLNDLFFKAKIWVEKLFDFDLRLNSNIINNIVKSDIRNLSLYGEILLLIDYIKLVKNGRIEELKLSFNEIIFITNSKKMLVTVKDVMKYIPVATNVMIKGLQMMNEQEKYLIQISQSTKLQRFVIYCPKTIFKPLYFFKFVKKNAAPNAVFQIYYDSDMNESEYQKFEEIGQMFAKYQWSSKENAPVFLKDIL